MTNPVRILWAVCLVAFPATLQAAEHPTEATLRATAARCRELLHESVVDFYLPSVDRTHGGYLQDVDPDGQFYGKNDKFLVFQARQLWLFSVLADAGIDRAKTLPAAQSGFEFIQTHFLDHESGGGFSTVSQDGVPVDTRKHAYLNAFALYGCVAYYEASSDRRALKTANQLFDDLEEFAHDKELGGYQEFFTRDWTLISDPDQPGYVGAVNTKTYNTHLHLLEAFSELQRVAPRPIVRRRLAELLLINTTTVRHPTHGCNIDGWTRDWKMIRTPSNLRHSYGHDIECAWLTLRAADVLATPRSVLQSWARSMVDSSMISGYDYEHGGFYNYGLPGGAAEDLGKIWWVQSEALVALLEMYRTTGEKKYYQAFEQTLDFCDAHQIAHREGGWWAARNADGTAVSHASRTSQWQAGYHNGRALLHASRILESLAKTRVGVGDEE